MNRDELKSAHAAVIEGAGYLPIEGWSTLRVSGGDRSSFLQNMCTNDVKSLAPGGGCEAFFTDVKGKIVAHAFVLVGEDSIDLVGAPAQAERLAAHLDRYIIREDVQLADVTAETEWTLLAGGQAAAAIDKIAGDVAGPLTAPWANAVGQIGELHVRVVSFPMTWLPGYLLSSDPSESQRMRQHFAKGGTSSNDIWIWHTIRVESAWPMWGIDFDDANLPQEVDRDAWAISFRKGCYLGQETVARIDALGHVNKKLAMVKLDAEETPDVGAELIAGDQSAGRITSDCWSPRYNAPIALAMLRRGFNEPGTKLECSGHWAEVLPKPSA